MSSRRFARSLARIAGAILVLGSGHAHAAELFAVGTASRPWAISGEFDSIDDRTSPGWIQPIRASLDENILHELFVDGRLYPGRKPDNEAFRLGRDGRIWSINASVLANKKLLMLADGLRDDIVFDYFDRLNGQRDREEGPTVPPASDPDDGGRS